MPQEKQQRATAARDAFDQLQRKYIGASAKDKEKDKDAAAARERAHSASPAIPASKSSESVSAARRNFEAASADYLAAAKVSFFLFFLLKLC